MAEQPEPRARLEALLDFVDDDEMHAIEKMSPAEVKAALQAAGLGDDVPRMRQPRRPAVARPAAEDVPPPPASGPDVLLHGGQVVDLVRSRPDAMVTPIAPRRGPNEWLTSVRRIPFVYAAAAAVAAVLAANYLHLFGEPNVAKPDKPDVTPPAPHVTAAPVGPAPSATPPSADELRAQAKSACDAKDWATCTALLDQAFRADPESERRADVQAMRKTMSDALTGEEKKAKGTRR